jgi:hypothetical protein
MPASVATTTEERVPDMLFLASSPSLLPLQHGCWRSRGYVLQARGDARAAAEIGQDGRGRQVALGDGDRGAPRAVSQEIRSVDAEVLEERDVQNSFGGFWRPTTGPRRPSRFGQG